MDGCEDNGEIDDLIRVSCVDRNGNLFYDTEMSAWMSIGQDLICNGRHLPLNRRNIYVADFYPCNNFVMGFGGAVL